MTDAFFINLHKALVIPLVLFLMWWFANYSVEMFLYLSLHGTYAILWLPEAGLVPRRAVRCPAPHLDRHCLRVRAAGRLLTSLRT